MRASVVVARGLSSCYFQAIEHMLSTCGSQAGSRAQWLWRGLSCFATCGIFQNQGSNPCLLHWPMDSLPLSHREAMLSGFFGREFCPVKMESHSPAFQRPEPCPRGTGWSGHLGTWLRCSGLCLSELPERMADLSGPHRAPVGP